MSSNYYLRLNICPHCGRYDEIHIGKYSSPDFVFRLYIHEEGPNSPTQWIEKTKKGTIYDEYGRKIPWHEFWSLADQSKSSDSLNNVYKIVDGFRCLLEEFS